MSSSERDPHSKTTRTDIGRHYEDEAALFFERRGFRVLERNWRAGRKEIDLIVRDDRTLVFVEVKAAATDQYGHPAEKVDLRKQANLTEAARGYIADSDLSGLDLRFDVVTFVEGKLEHYPAAFEATD